MHRSLDPGTAGPLVIAHRGASSEHPENTLASFAAAADSGADLVELDARLTADGAVVVLHDPDLERTTDLSGPVHEMTLEGVRRADASGGRGERVPTLEEVAALLAGTGCGIDVEIKNLPGEPGYRPGGGELVSAVAEALRGFPGPALITSFDPATLRAARATAPDLPTGLLTLAAEGAVALAAEEGHRWLLPHASIVDREGEALLAAAAERGVAVGTWTVDEEGDLERLFRLGVAAVATNRPALGVAVRDRVAGA